MKLNLQLFGGGGSSSGSDGVAASKGSAGGSNKYTAAYNYWKKETGSGVAELFREMESKNGGKLGDNMVSVPYEKVNRDLRKVLNTVQQTGGSDNFNVTRVGLNTYVNANRTGMIEFSERLKRLLSRGRKWY